MRRQAGNDAFQLVIFPEVLERAFAGDRLNSSDAGGYAAFFQNLDQANFSGGGRVRATAKFGREIANLDDADLVAIFFPEQGHGFGFVDGDINGHVLDDFDPLVAENFLVDDVFDVFELFVGHAGEGRKNKAQMVGRNQRSRLLHVLVQNFAQAGLQQMRGGVVAHGGLADFDADDGVDFIADVDGLLGDRLMRAHALNRRVASFYFGDNRVVFVSLEPPAAPP